MILETLLRTANAILYNLFTFIYCLGNHIKRHQPQDDCFNKMTHVMVYSHFAFICRLDFFKHDLILNMGEHHDKMNHNNPFVVAETQRQNIKVSKRERIKMNNTLEQLKG